MSQEINTVAIPSHPPLKRKSVIANAFLYATISVPTLRTYGYPFIKKGHCKKRKSCLTIQLHS